MDGDDGDYFFIEYARDFDENLRTRCMISLIEISHIKFYDNFNTIYFLHFILA